MQRILAVDDNEDILEIIKLILEDYNYEVITLADGHLLVDELKKYTPDLLLLDIMLGNMDGRELCNTVRSNKATRDMPIILISATHNLPDRFASRASHIDFLAKPFNISDLVNKVQSQLTAA